MANEMHEVIAISTYEKNGEQKKRFTRVGVAWPLRDKPGFSMRLDASAVSGEYLIKPKDRDQGGNDKDIPF